MTHAPDDLRAVQSYLRSMTGLPWVSLGIVGDDAHSSGGYHMGDGGTVDGDYSIVESGRDRSGLTDAASALDIGDFSVVHAGRAITLRLLSIALALRCAAGDPRCADIREIIYTPDGRDVKRWDRLGVRGGGDDSHLSHTHISFFRDSDGRRADVRNVFGVLKEIFEGTDDVDAATESGLNALVVRNGAGMRPESWLAIKVEREIQPALTALRTELIAVRAQLTELSIRPPVVFTDAQVAVLATQLGALLEGRAGKVVESTLRDVLGGLDEDRPTSAPTAS